MKREQLKTILYFVILLVITLFVRLFFLQQNMSFISLKDGYYQNAIVNAQGLYKMQNFGIRELYTKMLSIAMLLWGNIEIAGVYLNIFMQIIVIALIYFTANLIVDTYVSFGIAAAISVVPLYSDKIYELSLFNFLILILAVGLFIFVIICKSLYVRSSTTKNSEQDDNIMIEKQEEKSGVITLDDIIVDSNCSQVEKQQGDCSTTEEIDNKTVEATPPGMKEIIIDKEEKRKKVKLIENPLPIPKKREHKEMNFSVELSIDNDDYDIKDMTGMDYFDIE